MSDYFQGGEAITQDPRVAELRELSEWRGRMIDLDSEDKDGPFDNWKRHAKSLWSGLIMTSPIFYSMSFWLYQGWFIFCCCQGSIGLKFFAQGSGAETALGSASTLSSFLITMFVSFALTNFYAQQETLWNIRNCAKKIMTIGRTCTTDNDRLVEFCKNVCVTYCCYFSIVTNMYRPDVLMFPFCEAYEKQKFGILSEAESGWIRANSNRKAMLNVHHHFSQKLLLETQKFIDEAGVLGENIQSAVLDFLDFEGTARMQRRTGIPVAYYVLIELSAFLLLFHGGALAGTAISIAGIEKEDGTGTDEFFYFTGIVASIAFTIFNTVVRGVLYMAECMERPLDGTDLADLEVYETCVDVFDHMNAILNVNVEITKSE